MASVVLFALVAAVAACSAADSAEPDARTGNGIPDARGGGLPDAQGIRPDAQDNLPQPDAMQQITCDGADTEPNDTQLGATQLVAIGCGDGAGDDIVGSVISGNEDWFTYDSSDGNLCAVNPTFAIVGNVRVCAFFACLEGDLDLDLVCPDGTTAPAGPDGCCSEGGFEITSGNYNCLGTIDEASRTHVQITALSTDVCEAYTVSYNM